MNNRQQQYGVLLLNMGGPGSLAEVEGYIYSLLADPDMIKLPLAQLWQKPLARFIARRRAPKVRKRYELIGGKSPIGAATARQAELLSQELGLPVAYAMRYTPPRLTQTLAELAAQGVLRLVVLPLYPQYSTVSTLSSLKELQGCDLLGMTYQVVDRHYNDPRYISAMQSLLMRSLQELRPDLPAHLLFVAHSIPESYIRAGDPYAGEVEETVRLISAVAQPALPYSLAYSSRVGPVKWRGPSLEEALVVLQRQGIKQLVVQPVSFVSENLETLYDLDIDFRGACQQAGIAHFLRVPTLSDTPKYITALSHLAQQRISAWEQGDA